MKSRLLSVLVLVALLLASAGSAGVRATSTKDPGVEQRVIVHFQPGRKAEVAGALERVGAKTHFEFDDLGVIVVSLPAAALAGVQRNPNVLLVEEDVLRYPMDTGGDVIPYGIDLVQARDVWDADRNGLVDTGAPTGAGIKVCVIDSGILRTHEDFAGVTITGGYPTGWDNDTCGHGTHVAGTIAAALNGKGVVGVTPGGVSFYFVQVFSGAACAWTYSSTLVDAANRCQSQGAKVISMSLGGAKKSVLEQRAFDNYYKAGILSIAAAGNEGTSALSYPASYSSVVSVAAIDANKVVADFSQYNAQVELAAPGVAVLSTVPWISSNALTVDGVTYPAGHIEFAPYGNANGDLVDGGRCATAGAWAGKVVLCERGDISFYDKVMAVQNGGGVAAVIYNNVPGGFLGTLGDGNSSSIVAISLSQEDGQYLVANKLGQMASVETSYTAPASGYEAWDGTSMATPHVSAVAALVWSANPAWTNANIREALTSTAFDLGAAGFDVYYGYGLVQAKAALDFLGGGTPVNQPPVASFTSSCSGRTCTFNASASYDPDGTITNYGWAFGDGTFGEGVSVTHTYPGRGTYAVLLTVTDNAGATATASKSISIKR